RERRAGAFVLSRRHAIHPLLLNQSIGELRRRVAMRGPRVQRWPSSVAMLGKTNVEPRDAVGLLDSMMDTGGDEDHVADFDRPLGAPLVLAVYLLAARDERPGALLDDPHVDRVLVELGAVVVRRRALDVANVHVVQAALEQPDHDDPLIAHPPEVLGELLLRKIDRPIERRLVQKERTGSLRQRRTCQDAKSRRRKPRNTPSPRSIPPS